MMTFLFKKTVSLFLLPLPFGLILVTIGFILFLLNRAKLTYITCLTTGTVCLIVFSMPVIGFCLINGLQRKYQPLLDPPKGVNQIVVLGGGVSGGKNYPPNISLNASSLSRLIEGIRQFHLLKKRGKQPTLILSGGRVFQSYATNAGQMRNTAVMLGIPSTETVIEDGSRDTHEEAKYLYKALKGKPFILVTSAFHMPRSMALFEKRGMRPIAAPTQFFNLSTFKLKYFVPGQNGLLMSDLAIHEYLGMLWSKVNHQI